MHKCIFFLLTSALLKTKYETTWNLNPWEYPNYLDHWAHSFPVTALDIQELIACTNSGNFVLWQHPLCNVIHSP